MCHWKEEQLNALKDEFPGMIWGIGTENVAIVFSIKGYVDTEAIRAVGSDWEKKHVSSQVFDRIRKILADTPDRNKFVLWVGTQTTDNLSPETIERSRFFGDFGWHRTAPAMWDLKQRGFDLSWSLDGAGSLEVTTIGMPGIDHWCDGLGRQNEIEEFRRVVQGTFDRLNIQQEFRVVPANDVTSLGYHSPDEWTEEGVWSRNEYTA